MIQLISSQIHDSLIETFGFYFLVTVGGGSAGAVVANRLSLHNRVLLLEAGGDPNPLARIPVTSPILLGQPNIDWRHRTVPQTNASQGLAGHVNPTHDSSLPPNFISFGGPSFVILLWVAQVGRFPRGKGLGGTSMLNSMIYMRGHPKDYDNWASITGDPSWTYEALIPFFRKLENYHGHFPNGESRPPLFYFPLTFDLWKKQQQSMGLAGQSTWKNYALAQLRKLGWKLGEKWDTK